MASLAILGCAANDEPASDGGVPAGPEGGARDAGMAIVEGTATSADGVDIWYRSIGPTHAGVSTLVLLPGGPGFSSRYLLGLERLASPEWRVIRVDPRGVGGSSKPKNDDYGITRFVEDLDAVLSKLGVEKFTLLGHSWGGFVAMNYAIQEPHRLDGLLLLSSLAAASSQGAAFGGVLQARIKDLQARGLIHQDLPNPNTESCAWFAAVLPAYLGDPEFPVPPELTDVGCDENASGRTWDQTSANGYDLREALSMIQVRALVAMGELDFLAGAEAPTAAAFEPDAAVERIAAAGHFPWVEEPEATFAVIRDFLAVHD